MSLFSIYICLNGTSHSEEDPGQVYLSGAFRLASLPAADRDDPAYRSFDVPAHRGRVIIFTQPQTRHTRRFVAIDSPPNYWLHTQVMVEQARDSATTGGQGGVRMAVKNKARPMQSLSTTFAYSMLEDYPEDTDWKKLHAVEDTTGLPSYSSSRRRPRKSVTFADEYLDPSTPLPPYEEVPRRLSAVLRNKTNEKDQLKDAEKWDMEMWDVDGNVDGEEEGARREEGARGEEVEVDEDEDEDDRFFLTRGEEVEVEVEVDEDEDEDDRFFS